LLQGRSKDGSERRSTLTLSHILVKLKRLQ
jgi:hypothetical protein